MKEQAIEILSIGIAQIIKDYTENALLINACFVCKDRYETIKNFHQLCTTRNIPDELRLDYEIEVVYSKEELVEKYSSDLLFLIYNNYVTSTVSKVDATLEDMYEIFLRTQTPTLNDQELEKIIRNAWTNDNMLNFFINQNELKLLPPNHLKTPFKEAFYRYYEYRIIRHSIIHNEGFLTDKNKAKIKQYYDETPAERKHFSLYNSRVFDINNKVVLDINTVLSFRQYLDRFLMYILKSIEQSA